MSSKRMFPEDDSIYTPYTFWLTSVPNWVTIRQLASFINSISDWCENNCQGHYRSNVTYIDFELKEDFVLASLSLYDNLYYK